MNIRLLPEAVEEANAAALWYDKRRLGLGDEFLAELQSEPPRIQTAPVSVVLSIFLRIAPGCVMLYVRMDVWR